MVQTHETQLARLYNVLGFQRVIARYNIIIIIQFLYSANSRTADRCAAQEKILKLMYINK